MSRDFLASLESQVIAGPVGDLHLRRSPGPWPPPATAPAPLLFVHGYPDSSQTWLRQLEELGAERPVAAFDLRGAGRSAPPAAAEAFAIPAVLADFTAVIDALVGPKGQVHLVGHDWGAVLAWAFVSDRPSSRRVRSLTAIAGPHPALVGPTIAARLRRPSLRNLGMVADQLRRSWYILAFQIPGLGEAIWRRDPLRQSIAAHRRGGLPRAVAKEHIDPETVVADTVGLLGLYRQLGRQLGRQLVGRQPPLPSITTPTLAIVPRQDFALAPFLYDRLPELVDDLDLRYVDGNHWIHAEQPALINALIRGHVDRVDA